MLVCDGLKGLPDSVAAVWPETIVQTLSVHNGGDQSFWLAICVVMNRTYANVLLVRSACRPVRSSRGSACESASGRRNTFGVIA